MLQFIKSVLAAGGVADADWIGKVDITIIDAPISKVIEWAQEALAAAKHQPWNDYANTQSPYDGLQDSGVGGLSPESYIGDKYYESEIIREYVNEYIEGDLAAAAKVLVSGWNGDLISGDTGFWPDRIIRQQAGYEPESLASTTGGHLGGSGGGADAGQAANPTSGGRSDRDQQGGGSGSGASGTSASGAGSQSFGGQNADARRGEYDHTADEDRRPILLDLNGNGVQITELTKSTQFIDASNDGLKHRSAWAAAGDGVLFYDADNDNSISQTREYVFTEWDPTAKSDMQALRARFDSNNDGKLTAADAAFAQFKVMVTQADGSQVAQSLSQLGITEIRLTEDATQISLTDGSMIDGQSTFVMNGVTGTVASAVLMAEVQGCRAVETANIIGVVRGGLRKCYLN